MGPDRPMMHRREALLLVERLKRRTRDPDVLALCGYFEQKLAHTPVRGFWTLMYVGPIATASGRHTASR